MAQYIKTEEGYKGLEESISAVTDNKMDKTNPTGTGSFSMNRKAGTVIGTNSHAEGNNTTASGYSSHAEGIDTTASGYSSHAEGNYTYASKDYSHAEGSTTTASGYSSHTEGNGTKASGYNSHAEGGGTTASGNDSHAEGSNTTASGIDSHAEGYSTNQFSSVVTTTNPTTGDIITAWETKKFSVAKGNYSHIEGKDNLALNDYSHAEGSWTTASNSYSHAEGNHTTASGQSSHAEGSSTTASGGSSHAEGSTTTASGQSSHAEGLNTTASGQSSHAEGLNTTAKDKCSHAEGGKTTASGQSSHAEGNNTTASGGGSHAEGVQTTASGQSSHAEGGKTTASGIGSHAEGLNTTAKGKYSHVQGKYNIEDSSSIYADIIGNGTSNTARSNATTVDWNGNAWFAGDVYTGSTSGTNKDEGSKKLATEEYVNNSIAAGGTDISLGLTSAAVGQIIKVKAIDASGKPTAWEAAELPNGMKLIYSNVLTETVTSIIIDNDLDGNAFSLSRWKVCLCIPPKFVDYGTPIYMYCVDGDTVGFSISSANVVVNDASGRNTAIYETVSDHFAAGIFYKYGDINNTDCRYFESGVKSTAIKLFTYDADKPFPVGTFVEVYGK